MGILNATFILLTVLPVQDPVSTKQQAPRPESFIHNIHAYPQETIAVFGMNPVEPHRAYLQETSLYAMWQKLAGEGHSQTLVQGLLTQAAESVGLTPAQLKNLALQGTSIGITGWQGDTPDWLGIAELGDRTSSIEQALAKVRASHKETTKPARWQETSLWEVSIDASQSLYYAVHGTSLIFGSSAGQVGGAIGRLTDTSSDSILSNKNFQRFLADVGKENKKQALLAGYIDLGATMKRALPLIPARQRETITRTLRALHINEMYALGLTTRISGGVMHDHVRLCMPNPERGLLGTLLVAPKKTSLVSAKYTPVDVTSYALTHIDFERFYEELLTIATVIDPSYPSMIREMVRSVKSSNEFDLESDLLQNLGDEVVTMQWQNEETGKQEFAVILNLRDGSRLDRALSRFRQLTGKTLGNFKAYNLSQGAADYPGLAIGPQHLVIASTPARLKTMTEQITESQTSGLTGNTQIEALLKRTSSTTVGIGWSDLSQVAVAYFDQVLDSGMARHLPRSVDTEDLRSAFLSLASQLGELKTSLAIDSAGVSMRTHSTSGNLLGLATAFTGAAAQSMPDVLTGTTTPESLQRHQQHQDEHFRRRLEEIGTALASQQKQIGGRYPSLSSLLASEAITAELIGEQQSEDTYLLDDYLVAVLQPAETEQPEHFALVAWPSENKTGTVYICLNDLEPKANDLIAGTKGMERIHLQDLFLSADIDGELASGWRTINSTEATVSALDDQISSDTIEDYNSILAIESGAEGTDPAKLIQLLSGSHATVAARAAFAMGKLKYKDGIKALSTAVAEHQSLEVRQHAMAALVKMRDASTIDTSVTVLAGDDETLRTLAAQNLGRLQAKAHSRALLAVLRRPTTADATGEDKVQAILALTDLGEPKPMLSTAEAVKAPTKAQSTALAFMFQTLSPKLPPSEEATTLMGILGHQSTTLRRYAITRLGQLRDPKTVSALEKQLATEGKELQPLVEIALNAVRGDEFRAESSDLPPWLDQHWQKAQQSWHSFSDEQKTIVLGGCGGLVFFILGTSLFLRQRRRRAEAESWASMVNPSDEFDTGEDYVEGEYEDGEYAEGEYAEGEYAEGDYIEGEQAEGEYEDGEYEDGEYEDGEYAEDEDGDWVETEDLDTVGASDSETEETY